MFCYVHRGKFTKKRQQQHDENKIVEMRMTTTKRSLGNASIGPHKMKFQKFGTKQRLQEHWQKKAQVGNIRR
jgi:hypothetical protein